MLGCLLSGEVVRVYSFDFIRGDRGDPNIVVNHQGNEFFTTHENDLAVNGRSKDYRLFGKCGCRDEDAFPRSLSLQGSRELLHLRSAYDPFPPFGLHVDHVKAETIFFDDPVDAPIAAFAHGLPRLLA